MHTKKSIKQTQVVFLIAIHVLDSWFTKYCWDSGRNVFLKIVLQLNI